MSASRKDRVLVVDDEPQVLVALQDVLGSRFQVMTADTATSALNLLESVPDVSVLITDQRMPNMTGDELLAKAREKHPAVSILLTGYADLTAVVRAVNDGRLFAYVTKPWNADDLRQKVAKAAEHFHLGQDLRYERQLLSDLMRSARDVIFFKDRDLRFLRVNRAFGEFFGVEPDDVVGRRLAVLGLEPERVAKLEAEERDVIELGKSIVDDVRVITHATGQRWFSATKAPVRTAGGEIVGLVAVARDVTERMRADLALRESEERSRKQSQLLNSILDSMAEGVWAVDRAGNPVMINRQAERILGGKREVPVTEWAASYGLQLADGSGPVPVDANPLVLAMAGKRAPEIELRVENESVRGAVVGVNATPLRDEHDQLAGGIALLRDVTDERKLEQQLMQAQKMEAIGLLAGGVAHDFNNLLAVVASCADIVFTDLPSENPLRDEVGEIIEATRRAASLTRQLLAFSRQQVAVPKVIDLNVLVAETEKMLRRVIGEDIQLSLALSPKSGLVRIDPGQLEQIILNLAVNARDAMPNGGRLAIETRRVEHAASMEPERAPGSYVLLAVADTGSGMSAETQRRIFEPFFTTKDVGKGTGLGLATVYGIVVQNGGFVDVHSEIGRGTRFEVHLPCIDGKVDSDLSELEGAEQGKVGGTILVVEDDEAVRRVAVRILRRHGYQVFDARGPAEARKIVAERGDEVDLVLTDVVMPETSGPRMIEELKRAKPDLRVLFMSGYPGGSATHSTNLDPSTPFLQKPFTPASLLEKLREVL